MYHTGQRGTEIFSVYGYPRFWSAHMYDGCPPGKLGKQELRQVDDILPPRWTRCSFMEGDHPGPREGNLPVPAGAPTLHNVSGSSAPGVHPYPNIMAYNVFSSKGAPASPAFYANAVPPAYPGIYVAPQPAVMYSPHPFYPGMVPFPGAFPAHIPAQDAEEKKPEERKQTVADARAVSGNSSSDDSQLGKERGPPKRTKQSQGPTQTRHPEMLPPAGRYSLGSDSVSGGNDAGLATAAGNNGQDMWRHRNTQFAPGADVGQDDREVKRQRRKQSNRESARRSRLRKQAECEQLAERVTLLEQENARLKAENVAFRDKLISLGVDLTVKEKDGCANQDAQDHVEDLKVAVEGGLPAKLLDGVADPQGREPASGGDFLLQELEQVKEDLDPLKKVAILSLDGSPEKGGVNHAEHTDAPC
eukprot:jgi/Botrbrau1/15706/Bobra.4_1s0079.1